MNKVIIKGNLTRDPELRYTPSGTAVCSFGLAINEKWQDHSGEWQERVNFFDVECWKRLAENVSQYMSKGSPVLIDGRLKQDRWEKDGQKRSKVKIVAQFVEFLYPAPKKDSRPPEGGRSRGEDAGQEFDMPDEDVPF